MYSAALRYSRSVGSSLPSSALRSSAGFSLIVAVVAASGALTFGGGKVSAGWAHTSVATNSVSSSQRMARPPGEAVNVVIRGEAGRGEGNEAGPGRGALVRSK